MRRSTKLLVITLVMATTAGFGAGARPTEPQSPLAAYPGFGHDLEGDEERFLAEEREREELVAACMVLAGFLYVPSPPVVVTGAEAEPPDDADPNDAFVALLSPAHRTAYHMALVGVPDPYSEDAEALDPDGGCVGQAQRALPGVYTARTALATQLADMERAIADDQRIAEATHDWSVCMHERGYRFENPADAYADLDERIGTLSDPTATAEAHAAVLEASEACAGELRSVTAQVRREAEERFVAEHRQTLERYS